MSVGVGDLTPRCGTIEPVSTSTTTKTIERPEVSETDRTDDDTPKFFHYVNKDKIAESAVLGTFVLALCGEVFPVTRQAKPGSPVCPECKEIYESFGGGGA